LHIGYKGAKGAKGIRELRVLRVLRELRVLDHSQGQMCMFVVFDGKSGIHVFRKE